MFMVERPSFGWWLFVALRGGNGGECLWLARRVRKKDKKDKKGK